MLPDTDWSKQVTAPYMPPRTKLEREIQLLWQTVLNRKTMISVEADFTQQGGGMMQAIVVNGIIRYPPAPAACRPASVHYGMCHIQLRFSAP